MIHRKEWTTCDRCGAKIDEIPGNKGGIHWIRTKATELDFTTVERAGYTSNVDFTIPEITSAKIVEYYLEKNTIIHLCGKCRKDFKRFMKNV